MGFCMVAPTTDAKTVGASGTTFFNSADFQSVTFTAPGLAGVEEVDIYILEGNGQEIASDLTGTAYKLTDTVPSVNLVGGPVYAVAKDATVAAVGVFANPVLR